MICNICNIELKPVDAGIISSRTKGLMNGKKSAVGKQCPKCKKMRVKTWKGGDIFNAEAREEYFSNYPEQPAKEWLDDKLNNKQRSPREIYAQDFNVSNIDKEDWWNYSEDGSVLISMWMDGEVGWSNILIQNLAAYTGTSENFWIIKKHIYELFEKGGNNE